MIPTKLAPRIFFVKEKESIPFSERSLHFILNALSNPDKEPQ